MESRCEGEEYFKRDWMIREKEWLRIRSESFVSF